MRNRDRKPRTLHDVVTTRNVMVEMRDGVRLATDLYLPAVGETPLNSPLPAVLIRTPYNKDEFEETHGLNAWFAKHGYVAVAQDCRGCFNSEGEVNFLFPEAEDGFDTLQWIDQQPWTNGKVGTWGTSWCGWVQTAMAALGPKNLAAMVPNMSGSNAHQSTVRHGGAFELRFLAWAFWHSAYNTQHALKSEPWITPALNSCETRFGDWLTRMPIRPGQTQLNLVPPYEKWAFEIFTHSDYDEYWKHPSVCPAEHWDSFPDIPILLVGGWYDSYTRSTFENFIGLSSRKKGPVHVLVGPWTHGSDTVERNYAGDTQFTRDAALASFMDLHLRWFDRWLKGIVNGVDDDPKVRIYVMGGGSGARSASGRLHHGGKWRNEQEWPLSRSVTSNYYLHADGSLRESPPADNASSTSFTFDPENPVPSIGGNVSSHVQYEPLPGGIIDPSLVPRTARVSDLMSPGGYDQTERSDLFGCRSPYLPLSSRSDVLVFQTALLNVDLEVTGPVTVRLWVTSDALDTDFTAKLIDVYPPSSSYPRGYTLNLSDSIFRLRYRNGPERGHHMKRGEIAEIEVTLYPTSNLFVIGHRVRLDISSSNFPRFDINPNTGEAIGQNRRLFVATNTVYHNREHSSHLVLPVVR